MKKTFILLLVLCTALSLTALGDEMFTDACQARLLARQTMKSLYGLTNDTLGYFNEVLSGDANGWTVQYYALHDDLDYVLGRYTVKISGDHAEATWSWDGKEIPYQSYRLASHAWGKDQLMEIWLINKQTADLQNYALIARGLAQEAGYDQGYIAEIPEIWDTDDHEAFDPSKAKLSPEQCYSIALAAVQNVYGYSDSRMADFKVDREALMYDANTEGDPIMTVYCEKWDANGVWQEGDGQYTVTVNLATGLVENLTYNDGIIGNG